MEPGSEADVTSIANTIIGILAKFQDLLLMIGGGVVAVMMILAGVRYITGDAKSAKAAIAAALTGAVIITLAYVILGWVCDSVQASCSV